MTQINWIIVHGIADRKSNVESLQQLIPGSHVYNHEYDTDIDKGKFNAHIHAIKYAYDQGYQHAIILEDDVKPTHDFNSQNMDKLKQFILSNEYNLIHLSHVHNILNHSSEQINQNIYKVRSLFTCGYIISRSMMEKLKDYQYIGIKFDQLIGHAHNIYGYYPVMFENGNMFRDTHHPVKSVWPHIPESLRSLTNSISRMYTRHVNVPISCYKNILFLLGILMFVGINSRISRIIGLAILVYLLCSNFRT